MIQKFRKIHSVYTVHSTSVEISEILPHTFLAKISWKHWFYFTK